MVKQTWMFLIAVVATCLVACGNNRQQQKEQFLREMRSQYYAKELKVAEAELRRTDSLLQLQQAAGDTMDVRKRIRLDSLKLKADVQGARIRYIHQKQKERQ